jgi:hypothetical protein
MVVVIAAWLIGSLYVWKLIGYSVLQQLKDIFIYLALSVAMYFILIQISNLIVNTLFALIVMTATGVILYVSAAWILKLDEMLEVKQILNKRFAK